MVHASRARPTWPHLGSFLLVQPFYLPLRHRHDRAWAAAPWPNAPGPPNAAVVCSPFTALVPLARLETIFLASWCGVIGKAHAFSLPVPFLWNGAGA
jgi:hypothetical protein